MTIFDQFISICEYIYYIFSSCYLDLSVFIVAFTFRLNQEYITSTYISRLIKINMYNFTITFITVFASISRHTWVYSHNFWFFSWIYPNTLVWSQCFFIRNFLSVLRLIQINISNIILIFIISFVAISELI